jgi:LysR family glycine cleavage system transcriptional activator
MADQMFPVCSPALLAGKKPLNKPEDLCRPRPPAFVAGNDDDWRLWLTAAGLPTNLSKQTGVTSILVFHDRAGRDPDGVGVAMGRTS